MMDAQQGSYPPQQQPAAPPPMQPPAGPEAYYPPAAEPPRQANSRVGTIVLIVIVVALAVIVGGFFLFRDSLSGAVGDLAVGDCIDEPSSTTSITEIQHRPCAEAHDGEVFYVLRDPAADGATYPGPDYFRSAAQTACLPAASSYVGADINTRDDLDIGWFYPTQSSWSDGDRGMTCYLYNIDGTKLTGPLRVASGN